MCLKGYSQQIPVGGFDVLGVSPAMSLNEISTLLTCEVANAQTGAFGAPEDGPQVRGLELSCVGELRGSRIV